MTRRASAKGVTERLLGEAAVRAGLVETPQVDECLAMQEQLRAQGRRVPRIGELLAHKGYLTRAQVKALLGGAFSAQRGRFGEIAVRLGLATRAQVKAARAEQRRRDGAGESPLAIGQILRDLGAMRTAQVRAVLRAQGKAVARCKRCKVKLTVSGFEPGRTRCKRCDEVLVEERESGAVRDATVAQRGTDVVSGPPRRERLRRGAEIAGFRVQAQLGEDMTGSLYRALELARDRVVALKLIDGAGLAEPRALREFLAQAQRAATLDHPAIKKLYKVGTAGAAHYLAMEYVKGDSLRQVLERAGKLPPPMVLALATQLVDALIHAADHGLIHGDLRPANVILDERGRVKLSGFGVPVDLGGNLRLFARERRDSACYLAPEQVVSGSTVDARADVFGLGCTLYHLLAGRPPLSGRSPVDVLLQMSERGIPSLRKLAPKAPPELVRVVTRMVELEPGDRYASLYQLERELQVVASQYPELAV